MSIDRVEDAYRRNHPRLWHALFAYCGDTDVASDAESEAFTQALRRGDKVRDVDAWVWRCAFRVAGGLLKNRHRDLNPVATDHLWDRVAGADQPPVVDFLSQLDGLSDQQRAVVVLRYVGEFKPTEIAKLLHTTPGVIRVQLHRAHAHLRVSLEEPDA